MNQLAEFAPQWGGLVLGAIGTALSILALVTTRAARRRAQRLESDRLLSKAWDLLANQAGATWIFGAKNEAERLEEARRLIQQALFLDRNYAKAHMYLGVYWQFMREFENALASHNKAIKLDRIYASAYNNRGKTYCQMGNTQAGIDNYRLALKYDCKFAYAKYNLGSALLQTGDIDGAICELKWVSKRQHCPAKVFTRLGDAYIAAGDTDMAEQHYRRATQLDPGDEQARSRLDNLILAAHSSP